MAFIDFMAELDLAREELQLSERALTQFLTSIRSVRDKENKVARLEAQINRLKLRVSELELRSSDTNAFSIIQQTVANVSLTIKREQVEALSIDGLGSKHQPMDIDEDE